MILFRVPLFAALVAALGCGVPASAQDAPVPSPREVPGVRPAPPTPETYLQAAPPRAPEPDPEGLERARAAARAADPDQIERDRARDAARKAPVAPSVGTACLSARDARGAIRSNRAVPLARAARAARGAWDGEVIDYRLCSYDGALAYELTLLNADGKVARARVDAATGRLMGVR